MYYRYEIKPLFISGFINVYYMFFYGLFLTTKIVIHDTFGLYT